MRLPAGDRAALAQRLLDSLCDSEEFSDDVARAWAEEIERRRASIRMEESELTPWETARVRLRQELRERRLDEA